MDLTYGASQSAFSRPQTFPTARYESTAPEIAYVVVDDDLLRQSVTAFLGTRGIKTAAFATAADCLAGIDPTKASCVILNLRLRDSCGLALQQSLNELCISSIIFLYDECDIHSAIRGIKAGALEFLSAPIDFESLEIAVRRGQAKARRQRQTNAEMASLRERLSLLTPREREVMILVVCGLLNKQAASELGITETTLQVNRSRVMTKMRAGSFAELVRMSIRLRIPQHYTNLMTA